MAINQCGFNNLSNALVKQLFQFLPDKGFEMANVDRRCSLIAYIILDWRADNCDSGLADFLKRKYFGQAFSLQKPERKYSDFFISHSRLETLINLVSRMAANAYKNKNEDWTKYKDLVKPICTNFQNETSLHLFYKAYFLDWNLPVPTPKYFHKNSLEMKRNFRLNLISNILQIENDQDKLFTKFNEVIELLKRKVGKDLAIFTIAFELSWFSQHSNDADLSTTLNALVLKYADLIGLPLQPLTYYAYVVSLMEQGKKEEAKNVFNEKLANSGITFEEVTPFALECTLGELKLL